MKLVLLACIMLVVGISAEAKSSRKPSSNNFTVKKNCVGIEPFAGLEWKEVYRSKNVKNSKYVQFESDEFPVKTEVFVTQDVCKALGGHSWGTESCQDESEEVTKGACCCYGG